MITLNTKATVTDNSILMFPLPSTLPKGEYDILIVIDDTPKTKEPLWFMDLKGTINPNETFRREDMYDDNGR
ncbi:MAG: hypothetical protein HY958_11850 [Bacteroidia bacterium]|nr:hypothetical protein [Bacteroidia bacterium]